ncbi:MAG: YfhO family protein, partial [Ignavibacteriaceae bacterium]
QLTFPVLAGLGLMKIISLRKEPDQKIIKVVKNTAFVFTGIFVLSLLLNNAITSWFTERANAGLPQQIKALSEYAAGMFTTDLIMAFLFLSVTFWSAHLYINRKVSSDILVIIIILLTLIDLWRIDVRGAKYQETQADSELTAPEYIDVIKGRQDQYPHRILNLKQDRTLGSLTMNSNYHSAFLVEDFYGYSGIKPRAYQDYIDVVGPANPTLWRMANVKYIITEQPVNFPGFNLIQNTQSGIVYEYSEALPRVYLVNRVEKKDNLEFLNMVKASSFDPKDAAFVHDKEINADRPDSTASVSILNYLEDKLIAEVNATGNNFLFFSNTYLPTGWKAFVDGRETEIVRANHAFMGLIVPAGKHNVEFVYSPDSFYISKNISLVLSSLVIAGLVFGIYLNRKKEKTKIAG